jgi:nucleoside-diphosphate-sugar epimerase
MTTNHKHDSPILVTGAAGAVGGIGRNLSEFLLARGYKLANLVELVVGQVPALKLAVIHEGLDRSEEIMLYEEWDDTKAGFLAHEAPKPYRTVYREETAHMIADSGDLEWLLPIRIYQSDA